MSKRAVLYTAAGARFAWYEVDVDQCTIAEKGSINTPEDVQYAWPDLSHTFLYVATADWKRPGGGKRQHLCAYRMAPGTGALTQHGEPRALKQRPVHISLDEQGRHVLLAYHHPAHVSVQRIAAGGEVGDEVPQAGGLDVGVYPHQIRALSSGDGVVMVTRGNRAKDGKPEDPGALRIYNYRDGVLTNRGLIAPNGGRGFGPRHVDFDPQRRWMYVGLETQNKLQVFRLECGNIVAEPLYTKDTYPDAGEGPQVVGAIHVHPNGRFVYLANRVNSAAGAGGGEIKGENSIAVFAIDQKTGEPTLIQRADSHGFHPRTFSIDPSGRMLVAANSLAARMEEGGKVQPVPPNLALFRIGADGKLDYVGRHDMRPPEETLFWTGFVDV